MQDSADTSPHRGEVGSLRHDAAASSVRSRVRGLQKNSMLQATEKILPRHLWLAESRATLALGLAAGADQSGADGALTTTDVIILGRRQCARALAASSAGQSICISRMLIFCDRRHDGDLADDGGGDRAQAPHMVRDVQAHVPPGHVVGGDGVGAGVDHPVAYRKPILLLFASGAAAPPRTRRLSCTCCSGVFSRALVLHRMLRSFVSALQRPMWAAGRDRWRRSLFNIAANYDSGVRASRRSPALGLVAAPGMATSRCRTCFMFAVFALVVIFAAFEISALSHLFGQLVACGLAAFCQTLAASACRSARRWRSKSAVFNAAVFIMVGQFGTACDRRACRSRSRSRSLTFMVPMGLESGSDGARRSVHAVPAIATASRAPAGRHSGIAVSLHGVDEHVLILSCAASH